MFNKIKQSLLGRHENTDAGEGRRDASADTGPDLRKPRRTEELDELPLENSTTMVRSPESILDQIDKEWSLQQVAFARAKVERDLLIDANSRIDFEHELQLKVRTRLLAEKQADKLVK